MYTKYLNIKTKLHKTIANIYFNKECLKHKLTPTYAKIKIKDTNKATLRIKNELKYLQIKKSEINNNLYYLQNDGVKIYGENWPIIENQIHEQIKHIINKKYNTINAKIERMKKTRTIDRKSVV